MNLSAKTVVVIAIGAALYGIGGLPMFGIPVFANTTLKPAMAVLALFSVLFGPLVGFLVGFIGHWVTDLFAGWGVWLTWVLGSGIVGLIIGLFPSLTRYRLEKGDFNMKDFALFVVLALLGNVFGYGCSAFLDTIYTQNRSLKCLPSFQLSRSVTPFLLLLLASSFLSLSLNVTSKAVT